jgi:hypothetical protein
MSCINFWKCTFLELLVAAVQQYAYLKNSLEDSCILGYDVVLIGTSLLRHFIWLLTPLNCTIYKHMLT